MIYWWKRWRALFRCNICGKFTACDVADMSREHPSCSKCGSTIRMRAVVHHVSKAVFGKSLPLTKFPKRPDIRGVGLSDWVGYAVPLAERFNYTNTYYHTEPFLDITNVPDAMAGSCDFIISTDVFEHVSPPVSKAFEGARKLLKPGGTLVLTVPFMLEESETREHFPHLHKFEIAGGGDEPYRMTNTRESGEVEVFDDLIFHGGPGQTLEMRLFARDALLRSLQAAGFASVKFAQEPVLKWGIVWPTAWSVPVIAVAPGGA